MTATCNNNSDKYKNDYSSKFGVVVDESNSQHVPWAWQLEKLHEAVDNVNLSFDRNTRCSTSWLEFQTVAGRWWEMCIPSRGATPSFRLRFMLLCTMKKHHHSTSSVHDVLLKQGRVHEQRHKVVDICSPATSQRETSLQLSLNKIFHSHLFSTYVSLPSLQFLFISSVLIIAWVTLPLPSCSFTFQSSLCCFFLFRFCSYVKWDNFHCHGLYFSCTEAIRTSGKKAQLITAFSPF